MAPPVRRSARISSNSKTITYNEHHDEDQTQKLASTSVRVATSGTTKEVNNNVDIIPDNVSSLSADEERSVTKNKKSKTKKTKPNIGNSVRRVVTPSTKDDSITSGQKQPRRSSTRKRKIVQLETKQSNTATNNHKRNKKGKGISVEITPSSPSNSDYDDDVDGSDFKSCSSSCSSYKDNLEDDNMSDHVLEIEDEPEPAIIVKRPKPKKKRARKFVPKNNESNNRNDTEEVNIEGAGCAKTDRVTCKRCPEKNESDNNDSSNNRNDAEEVDIEGQPELNIAGQPDGNGGLSRPAPYKVSYAISGRATCKRCDERIAKNDPRTTHRPLFRGKPGFEVHRHLKCTIFNVDVKSLDDVAGHEDLRKPDLDLLIQRITASQEEIKHEMEQANPDELTAVSYGGPIRDPPEGLIATLLPFQKEGTSWMYEQEVSSPIKGGILADEMGMGKTLQSITLVLDHKSMLQRSAPNIKHPPNLSSNDIALLEKEEILWNEARGVWIEEFDNKANNTKFYNTKKKKNPFPLRGGTLVICPVIALYQWKSEIEKFTSNNLKVCIYHGPNRQEEYSPAELSTYDIVLTTYNVIESDYRKMVISTQKISCPNCGKKFKLDRLQAHLKYFCGDGAQKTEAQARQHRKNQDRPSNNNGKNNSKKKSFSKKEDADFEDQDEFEVSVKKKEKKKQSKKRVLKKSVSNKKRTFKDDYDDSDSDDASHFLNDDFDIDQLIKEHQNANPSSASVLHGIIWWRIILDEAHYIKSRSSQTSASAFNLIAIYRWCLSGTPLQNRVGEFYSLIRFLRINPMGYYYCRTKGCNCASLHYKMFMGKCTMCNCSSIQHYSHFNKHVLNPIQRDGYQGDGRRAMFLLKDSVLDKCLLRRTKSSHAEDMNLPPRCVSIQFVKLHPIEEDFYNALYTQTRSSFSDYVADGTLLNNYAHIFDLLVRMRQAVCHPYLVVFSKRECVSNMVSSYHPQSASQESAAEALVANGSTDCEICHEIPTDRILSTCCKSAFCKTCVIDYMATSACLSSSNGVPCPSCQSPFSIDLNQSIQDTPIHSANEASSTINSKTSTSYDDSIPSLKQLKHVRSGSILRRIDLAQFTTSTKIESLMSNLVTMRTTHPASKAIVFSQFTNMLDLILWRIHSDEYLTNELGLNAVQVHGGLDVKKRNINLNSFQNDPHVRVLLISLKAGGVALNLVRANYIYLMDPWWNPAAEMQAIDRTHRLGQHRPIRAVRFIAENTVEERILQLQEKKRLVFDGTVGRDASSLTALSVDDMKCLFT